ncbi:MAG: PEGA domain-containing protein [Proteobacteria bacterium]|nr:PEGA domain-containing protein [Pseudomonadota bacterium]
MPGMDCDKVGRIWSDEVAGQPANVDETAFIAAHLESCPRCHAEASSLEQIRLDESSRPAPELDDLSRRRWIDNMLSRADSGKWDDAQRPSFERASMDGSKRRVVAYWAAVAAAAVLIVFGALFVVGVSEKDSTKQDQSGGTAIAIEGRVLLFSGDVSSDSSDVTIGNTLLAGERLQVGLGQAVLGLSDGVTVFLDERTDIRIKHLDSNQIAVTLSKGHLIAQVDPEYDGPDFEVATEAGSVHVTGTAFSVVADYDEVEVQVFRGSVRLEERTFDPRKVEVGQAAVLGRKGITSVSRAADAAAWDVLKTLDLLARSEAAVLELRSVPPGAAVSVDEIYVGKTPLVASLRAGHRKLDLSLGDREPVREFLDLGRNSRLSRVFDLGSAQEAVAQTAPDSSSSTHKVSPEPRSSSKPSPRKATSRKATPEELLALAQSFRVARSWNEAVRAYRDLIQQHPTSAEARSSLISLGSIQLEKLGKPLAALKSFDTYLKSTKRGTLAQEAAFGRAFALRALGRRDDETAALRAFLVQFPTAIQAPRVRARLEELE